MAFKKATKYQLKLRMAIVGPSKSGKTYTSLMLASKLGKRVALIDTERGSACRYADIFDFDTMDLTNFHPNEFTKALHEAEQDGYDVVVIDSLSHAWMGKGGALELHDSATARTKNSFTAWSGVTPLQTALIDAMLMSPCHIIVTMRTKTDWIIETDDKGRAKPTKVGLAPVQRQGIEYEFDIMAEMNHENTMIIDACRCTQLNKVAIKEPGEDLANTLKAWLTGGKPAPTVKEPAPQTGESEHPLDAPPAGPNPVEVWAKFKAYLSTQKPGDGAEKFVVDLIKKHYGVSGLEELGLIVGGDLRQWLFSTAMDELRQKNYLPMPRGE